ncbi:hypothetical protein MMC21_006694 [Puttea exsequens]|nr:hypothetical protein [Puttea exsequens]
MLKLNSNTTLALQQTSNGQSYGKIGVNEGLSTQMNASTYRVNAIKTEHSTTERAIETINAITEGAPDADSMRTSLENLHASGKEPVNRAETGQSASKHVNAQKLQLHQPKGFRQPTSKKQRDRNTVGRLTKGEPTIEQSLHREDEPSQDQPPTIPPPEHLTNESRFTLSREITQIMSQTDDAGKPQKTLEDAAAVAQPTIHDFSTRGPSWVKRMRMRSRSPRKRMNKQDSSLAKPDKIADAPNFKPPVRIIEASFSQKPEPEPVNSTVVVVRPDSDPIISPNTPESIIRKYVECSLEPSPIPKSVSILPSTASERTTAEEIHLATSSPILHNAQSAISIRVPQPGPAPTKALPSLPEGHNEKILVTPRSSFFMASREASPIKIGLYTPEKVPPKSPARYRYTPSKASSPSKPARPASSLRRNADTEIVSPYQSYSGQKQATVPALRPQTAPVETNARSSSVGAVDLGCQQRVESPQLQRAREWQMAQTGSKKVDAMDAIAGASRSSEGSGIQEGLEELPAIRDSFNSALYEGHHKHQPSQISNFSLSATIQQHRESIFSSHRLSPIITIASQEPMPCVHNEHLRNPRLSKKRTESRAHTQAMPRSRNSIDKRPRRPTTNGNHLKLSTYKPPSVHPQAEDDNTPTGPLHSVPYTMASPSHDTHHFRPVAGHAPIPFANDFLRAEQKCSSRHSSLQSLDDSETRFAAIERKIVMLQRLFMVMMMMGSSANYGAGQLQADGLS